MNQSFRKEFLLEIDSTQKKIFEIIQLNENDKKDFIRNLKNSLDEKIQNCEFTSGEKSYGYSLFRFQDQIIIIIKEITEIKNLKNEIFQLQEKLIQIGEIEKEKIAKELHDSIIQSLLTVKMYLEQFQFDPKKNANYLKTSLKILDSTNLEIKSIYETIFPRSIEELGFTVCMETLFQTLSKKYSISISQKVQDPNFLNLSTQKKIFRILSEFLNSLFKNKKIQKLKIIMKNQKKSYEISLDWNSKMDISLDLTIKAFLQNISAKSSLTLEGIKIEIPFP
jgi:two-component system, NarL family, sensor kinase